MRKRLKLKLSLRLGLRLNWWLRLGEAQLQSSYGAQVFQSSQVSQGTKDLKWARAQSSWGLQNFHAP